MNKKIILSVVSAAAIVSAFIISYFAFTLAEQRQQLLQQAEKQEAVLGSVKRFADEHSNYEKYWQEQQKKLHQLERKAQYQNTAYNGVQRLQNLAAKQKIKLLDVQILADIPKKTENNSQLQRIKITASGDFFDSLRWLRQVERDAWTVHEMSIYTAQNRENILLLELALDRKIPN